MPFLYGILTTLVLWTGNSALQHLTSHLIPWTNYPLRRTIVGIIIMVVYTTIMIIVVDYTFNYIYAQISLSSYWKEFDIQLLTTSLIITIIIALIIHSRTFLNYWRKAELEVEQLKRDQLASQYQTLKDQLNPHFLFNNLNTLSALVYKDADQAALFIRHLSTIYRYTLEHTQSTVVTLDEELSYINSYIHLLQIRFREALDVRINLPDSSTYMIPPLTLQILIENAIKHNVVAMSSILHIDINQDGSEYLVVANNRQPKADASISTGIGLNNIRSRFKHLTDRPIIVESDDQSFIVKIPLITYEASQRSPMAAIK